MTSSIVILAAGQGKRMQSRLPKVLHRIANKTLLEHVVHTALTLEAPIPPYVVYGHQGEAIKYMLANLDVTWVEQTEQLGTGHAVQQVLPFISEESKVLVLYGDVPLITSETLKKLITTTPEESVGIITATLDNPFGFGRIIRDQENNITRVVEEKDTNAFEKKLQEINTGIYFICAKHLKKWLPHLTPQNTQQEYYLTDVISKAWEENIPIHSIQPADTHEILGVNNRIQLAELERYYQRSMAEYYMKKGVTFYDPNRFDLRGELSIGTDVIIDINVIFEGKVTIGNHCTIGANTILRDVTLKDNVHIKANCVLEGAIIDSNSVIGPFARLRSGTHIAENVEIGNFIEIKNSLIGSFTKAHHVSYLGDSEIGKKVNIGAGTITCNYDGANKHKTVIGDEVFIGSNTELVAPINIGEGATIGAGSTITRDAPAHQLTLSRVEQFSIAHWQRKKKIEQEKET